MVFPPSGEAGKGFEGSDPEMVFSFFKGTKSRRGQLLAMYLTYCAVCPRIK